MSENIFDFECPFCFRPTDWDDHCLYCGKFVTTDDTSRYLPQFAPGAGKRGERRAARRRIIARRLKLNPGGKYERQPGRLAKYNLSCGCALCKFEKIFGIEKPKYRFDKRILAE